MSWAVYVRLGRVSNLPTVWTNVAAAIVLAGAPVDARAVVLLLVSMSLFYVGGMYLNDAFDREVDSRERPERPIPSGQITPATVFALGFGMLGAAVLVLFPLAFNTSGSRSWLAIASGTLLAAVIVYYDVRHKRDPLSPVAMAACRVLVYVTVALALTGRIGSGLAGGAIVLFSYLVGLTYVAKQETLAKYRNLWPLAFLFVPFAYTAPAAVAGATMAVLYVVFLAWVAWAISLLVRRAPGNIPKAVVSLLAGISLLDAVLIARAGEPAIAAVVVVGFVLTLLSQRWVAGT